MSGAQFFTIRARRLYGNPVKRSTFFITNNVKQGIKVASCLASLGRSTFGSSFHYIVSRRRGVRGFGGSHLHNLNAQPPIFSITATPDIYSSSLNVVETIMRKRSLSQSFFWAMIIDTYSFYRDILSNKCVRRNWTNAVEFSRQYIDYTHAEVCQPAIGTSLDVTAGCIVGII